MSIHIFGIRHHGPGCARSLCHALHSLNPDILLVEGPPDGDGMLPFVTHSQMQPPVALLVYRPDQPQRAVYYPFAIFSPEWQGIDYALTQGIPVRFMDLPLVHQLAGEAGGAEEAEEAEGDGGEDEIQVDPLGYLARIAGYSDGERWWEQLVEHRQESTDVFEAILAAMTALRQDLPPRDDPREAQREAYMRKQIRAAQKEGFQCIAVVCGAWHAPALVDMPAAKADNALLKGLAKTKVEATWIPWTYGRLAFKSGYGAGVESPGWYGHLWDCYQDGGAEGACRDAPWRVWGAGGVDSSLSQGGFCTNVTINRDKKVPKPAPTDMSGHISKLNDQQSAIAIRWLIKVAQLLRQEDLDASSAHIIEAVRLAESLAALRDRAMPGLLELNEATQTVLCFGSDLPMRLIQDQLIVGERLGEVPDDTPMVPLQRDLQQQQKRLRLPANPTEKQYELDLRKTNDLARSHLLHRLDLLGIPWGIRQSTRGKGTFKEGWRVQWHPEFAVKLIEAGIWGNTIDSAATAYTRHQAQQVQALPSLTQLVETVLLANLPNALPEVMHRLQTEATLNRDVAQLMEALPPLAQVLRYGNVRQTDTRMIISVVDGLVTRICLGLPLACASLDDEAARHIDQRIQQMNYAISLLNNLEYKQSWQQVLLQLTDQANLHGLLAGRSCRLLLDAGVFNRNDASRRLAFALSQASEPPQAAAWIEGFLQGSGLLLLHDYPLWQVVDDWMIQLPEDTFTEILPLLRRTFASFSTAERRQIGERVKRGTSVETPGIGEEELDSDRANAVLPIVAQLLGLK
ncbi:DUF5682 family protein [Coleofasciculus chthonoplastes]|uniref:DUF5682 family protein n=1 Tax=Coleofasciculus chthonoplastes TaxID=64178 RepID=UPI0032F0BAF8